MSTQESFLDWKMENGRFDNHEIPLEYLEDMARFERILKEVASCLYFHENSGVKARLPRGFLSGFTLALGSMIPGSVCTEIRRVESGAQSTLVDASGYYERARDVVLQTLDELEQNQELSNSLTESAAKEIGNFGKLLKGTERFNFGRSGGRRVIFSTAGRDAAKRRLPKVRVIGGTQESITLTGRIVAIDFVESSFKFLLDTGRVLQGRFSDSSIGREIRRYAGDRERAPLVEAQVDALVDEGGDATSISGVTSIDGALPTELENALRSIQSLEEGWLGEEEGGAAVEGRVVDFAEGLLFYVLEEPLLVPAIYPLERGGIRMEWSEADRETLVEIENDGEVFGYSFPKGGANYDRREFEGELSTSDRELARLFEFLRGAFSGGD